MQSGIGPRTCPGLTLSSGGCFWRDSSGTEHDLLKSKRVSPGEAAIHLNRSTEWVLRKIRANELFPVVYYNPRSVEVWVCGLDDFVARSLRRSASGGAGDVAA
jgi:methionyl-tRNA formyltransferase